MKYQAPFGSSDPDAAYVDRNSTTATSGSKIPAGFPNWTQREIVDVIEKSGLTPDDALQLAAAIQTGRLNYAVAAGTATAITATLSPAPDAYDDLIGAPIRLNMTAIGVSGAAPTLNLNGLGARSVISQDGVPLIGGEMQGIVEVIYDGASFRASSQTRHRNFIMSGITQTVASGVVVLTSYATKTLAMPASTELNGSITIGAADAGFYALNTFLACSPPVNNLTTQIQVNGVRLAVNSAEETGNAEGASTSALLRLNAWDVIRHCSYSPAGATIITGRFSGHRLSL